MHGTVTRFTSRFAARSPFQFPRTANRCPSMAFQSQQLQRFGRIAAGVLMVTVFCSSVFVLINGSNPGFQIMSSNIPSAADVGDWLMWR